MNIIIAAIIPALVLVYFIYRKDKYDREPPAMILKGFWYGALSALASFFISRPFQVMGLFPTEIVSFEDGVRTALFGAAVPEEISKFVFLWMLLRNNRYFDEYVDGIVYAVCVGMGFAAFENIGYVFSDVENWASINAMRALTAIPGHFFFAVMMGYYFSKASFGKPSLRTFNFCLAILVPVALHAGYDGILMTSNTAGAVGGGAALFFGLYFFMALSAKKRFNKLLAKDEDLRRMDFQREDHYDK